MRYFYALSLSAALLVSGADLAFAAGKCPSSAFKASQDLWPLGSFALNVGETKSGMHPCGRPVTCIIGNPHRGAARTCEWK